MTKTTKTLLLLAMLTLMVSACSDSQQGTDKTGAAADALCPAILNTGLAKQCTVSKSSVDVVIESDDDEVARETCTKITTEIKPLTAKLAGNWQLQIFSPYRSDKQTAACPLH